MRSGRPDFSALQLDIQSGFTLMEVLISMVLLAVGV
ncbi:MAG: prepilin-type N-terminal cleavage/methylation domain-containing protein, partial [Herminiimonas sp.]|nr:prepilin-type N-terminal cleavage/methylation domain-containing protein [Herminiimonas sp.]